ncbi:Cyclin-dependent kinase C-2 [Entamoeba marina]
MSKPTTLSLVGYKILDEIGVGTYSTVYRAQRESDNFMVAIKQLKNSKQHEGFPLTSLREIQLLQTLKHDNIVELLDVIPDDLFIHGTGYVSLVFEYMPHDLSTILSDEEIMEQIGVGQLKGYMSQLLVGLKFLHDNNILHRDIKTGNLLIDDKGYLKLTDFGLARKEKEYGTYTDNIVTLWYRSPELLCGETNYSSAIDMWSVGCIFAEIFEKRPLFQGDNQAEQLKLIFDICGSPNEENWPGYSGLPYFQQFTDFEPSERKLNQSLTSLDSDLLDLVDRILVLNPHKRLTAQDAIDHCWFKKDPRPLLPNQMKQFHSSIQRCVEKEKEKKIAMENEAKYLRRGQRSDERRGDRGYNRRDDRGYHGRDDRRYNKRFDREGDGNYHRDDRRSYYDNRDNRHYQDGRNERRERNDYNRGRSRRRNNEYN